MLKKVILATLASGTIVSAAFAAVVPGTGLYEEQLARQEERLIIATPIAGIENRYWFNYRTNVVETKKELASDLRRASDTEDLRDAWDEYRVELADQRQNYIKKMAKRGYRYGEVRIDY
ncbi:MAG: hypothetical protein AB7U35_11635 [Sphingobium sp.]